MIKTYLRLDLYDVSFKFEKEIIKLFDRVDMELDENVNDLLESFSSCYVELYFVVAAGESVHGNFVSSFQRNKNQWVLCPRKDIG